MITVVLITRNRRDELVAAVSRLLRLPERPPVVVVDNGSTDGSIPALLHPARMPPDAPVEVLSAGRNLGAAARNLGVTVANTPYVAFCDDDSGWRPGALDLAVRTFEEHPRLGLLAGRIEIGEECRTDPTCLLMRDSPLPPEPDLPGPAVLGFVACATVVRRRAFLHAGGFDPHIGIGGEEEPLALELAALGWGLSYLDDLVVHHAPSPVRDTERRRRVLARNRLRSAWARRRARGVLDETTAVLRDAIRDPAARRGFTDALADAPRVLRSRRPISRDLESRLRLLRRQPVPG